MKKKLVTLVLLGLLLLSGGLGMLTGHRELSLGERRKLAQWPKLTGAALLSGSFTSSADKAAADQFPFREFFRRGKALYVTYVLGQPDNNGIYVTDDSAAKLDYPLSQSSLRHAIDRIQNIVDNYLSGTQVRCYYSVIPDKNYFLGNSLGYPVMDYDRLLDELSRSLSMTYLDLFETLSPEDYYRTDPHWRQECLEPVASSLARGMGLPFSSAFETVTLGRFSGAYAGQSALPLEPDSLCYLENETLRGCTAYDPVSGDPVPIYDPDKLDSRDPYDLFLGGALPLVVLENPNGPAGRELVLFRDSFGSSLAPLLAASYSKITLVDLRYMDSSLLGNYVTFSHQDVLFLYSTLLLNSSQSLR